VSPGVVVKETETWLEEFAMARLRSHRKRAESIGKAEIAAIAFRSFPIESANQIETRLATEIPNARARDRVNS
jgi:hypothetical protein